MLITASILGLAMSSVFADDANFTFLPSGATPKIGGYAPKQLKLTSTKPAGLTKEPTVATPLYGVIELGGAKTIVIVDGVKLYVDSNGNGDLTDDAAPEWTQ